MEIEVGNLPSGLYLIRLVTDSGTLTEKFVKQQVLFNGTCYVRQELFKQFLNGFWGNRHFRDGAKARADVLQTGSKQIYFIIDNQETVVVPMRELDELYFGILGVVFLQVGQELLVIACVYGN